MKFVGAALDLEQAELQNLVIQKRSSPPLLPEEGELYYDISSKKYYFYNGSQWVPIEAGGEPVSELSYKYTITSWTPSSGIFYCDVLHNLNTLDVTVSAYSPVSGRDLGVEDFQRISANTVRVWSATNTENVRVIVMKSSAQNFSTTVSTWSGVPGGYYKDITHYLDTMDVVISVYRVSDNRTVGMDEVERIDSNTIRVWSATDSEVIRVNILKS